MYTHLEQRDSTRPPVSLGTLDKMTQEGEKIACITCYDASFAVLCDAADADLVLVGDSLGMVGFPGRVGIFQGFGFCGGGGAGSLCRGFDLGFPG